jgi:raffinose/stachyose/melibiose transport system substrate-binding protein
MNMKRNYVCFLLVLTFSLAACGGAKSKNTVGGDGGQESVSITVFNEWVGAHPFASYFNARLESFRKKYPNIIVNVEEIAGSSTANMDGKLKVQISAGELPDAFYTNDKAIVELAKTSALLLDMKPMLDADQEFASDLDMVDIHSWNDGAGHVYGISSSKDFFGFFYNKEIFANAGYNHFPATWNEFWDVCKKIKANGIAPISLETKTAWLSSLMLFALAANQGDAGRRMAVSGGVTNYNTPEFITAAGELQKLFMEYSTPDAPGADATMAINNFISGQTAMVLDGTWRIGEFTTPPASAEEFGKKVGVAMLPGKGMISYPGFAWFSGSRDDAKAKAAYTFIRHMNDREDQAMKLEMLGLSPASQNIDLNTVKVSPLMKEILAFGSSVEYSVISCWRIYPASITAIIMQEMAALATGQELPKEFAANLTASANQ